MGKYEDYDDVCKEIYNCKLCDFWQDLQNTPFKPSFGVIKGDIENYKVIEVGINPGWDAKAYKDWKEIYMASDFDEFKKKAMTAVEQKRLEKKTDRYTKKLITIYEIISGHLGFQDIDPNDIYKTVLYSNLSFCDSNNTKGMWKIDGKEIERRVYDKEIPNCLDKRGYLKKIIEIIKPEYLLIFTNHYSYKKLLLRIFDNPNIKTPGPIKFTMNDRATSDVTPCIVRVEEAHIVKVLFIPHLSNLRINSKFEPYFREVIGEACSWLKNS